MTVALNGVAINSDAMAVRLGALFAALLFSAGVVIREKTRQMANRQRGLHDTRETSINELWESVLNDIGAIQARVRGNNNDRGTAFL